MTALPSSLALTSIADGSPIIAADHRNNYAAVQTDVNGIITALSGGASGQVLRANSSTDVGWSNSGLTYRKVSATTVASSIAETDLLGGAVTVGAGVLSTTGILRLTLFGDWKQNSGAATDIPRFKLKLGATPLLDTSVTGANVASNSATRAPWRIVCEIANTGAANTQWASLTGEVFYGNNSTLGTAAFATGVGDTTTSMVSGTFATSVRYMGANSGAVDTTAAQALVLSVILPASSASTDIVMKAALVEVL